MKLSLVIVTAALVYLEGCFGAYWNQSPNHGPRRPLQRMGRDRPRPMRHHRHIQPHQGYPRPPPSRMHRPGPPGPHGHRRASRPPPPQYRHNFPHHNNNQGSMLIQPMIHNNIVPNSDHHSHHPHQQRQELGVPPPYFQQSIIPDEIIQEQSKHFPVTAVASPNQHPQSTPNSFQSTKDSQPHGYLSSTYKGWKPIVKPYQNSYMTPASTNVEVKLSPAYGMIAQHSSHPTPTLNLDTLFREQTEHMKTHALKQAFSENKGIRVPAPPSPVKPIKAIELPIWNKRLSAPVTNQHHVDSESVGVKKPINRPKMPPKIPHQNVNNNNNPPITDDSEEALKFPKFKFRQRPRPGSSNKDATQESQVDHTTSVLPPFPQKHAQEATTTPQEQQALNLKTKLITRGRVRVRTKPKLELPASQSGEESQSSSKPGPQLTSQSNSNKETPSSDNFPGRRNQQTGPTFGRPPPQSQESGEEFGQHSHGGFPPRGDRSPPRQNNQQQSSDSSPPNRGHYRQHHPTEQRIRKPESNLIERPPPESTFFEGPSESTETEPISPVEDQPQRGRRKRPKNGNKNKIADDHTQQPLPQPPPSYPEEQAFAEDDSYFPPGFHSDHSKNTGQHPVSFMTMPGGKPQVVHHTYPSHHPPQRQQLYPINVIRSAPDFQRPVESHGTNLNGNYVTNNRPHFATINVQNGPGQHHHHNQKPPRFPHHHHNSGPVFTSNSNHEPSYFPIGYGSHQSPHMFGGVDGPPPRPSPPPPPPHVRQHITPHSSMSPAAQNSPPPMRLRPPIPMPMPSSTTMRYPRYYSSSPPAFQQSSSAFSSVEIRDSSESIPVTMHSVTPPSSTFPSTSPAIGFPQPQFHQRQYHNPERSNAPTITFPEYAPAYSGSGEYDKIPMQFMDQLRPILRDDHTEASTTNGHIQHSHQSPHIHPPSSFFDEFFQPFDESFNPNPEQELDSKSSLQVENQVQPQYTNFNAYEGYNAEQSSPQPHFATNPNNPSSSSSTSKYSASSHTPIFSPMPEVSSVKNDEFLDVESSSPAWSKLQENELVASSTEQISSASPQLQPKMKHKVNPNKDQYRSSTTTSKTRIESKSKVNKDYHRAVERKTEQNIPPVTTYKPRFEETEDEDVHVGMREFGLKKYPTQDQEDNVESNTPKPVRFPGRNEQPIISPITDSPDSTTFKSRRHFRRRRPDASVRRRFFSSRVKSTVEEDKQPSTASPKQSIGRPSIIKQPVLQEQNNPIATIEHVDNGYEPSRISPFKQRRLIQRKKNLSSSLQLKGSDDDETSFTTPAQPTSSSESDTVTYGESQWFRIKPTDSSELEPSTFISSKPAQMDGLRSKSGTDAKKNGSGSVVSVPQFLPLDPSSETSSTEAGVKTLYSSKHSVSYIESPKFPVHKKNLPS